MTGNVVFLGFAIGGAPGFSILRCLAALIGFLAGAAIGGRLAAVMTGAPRRKWLLIVAVLETVLFFVAAWSARGYDMDRLAPASGLYPMILMTGMAMGLRNATVRQLAVPDLTTTVLTLTLTGLVADSFLTGGSNPRWQRHVVAVVSIFAGSALGAILVYAAGLAVPLVVTGACVMLATIAYAFHPASKLPANKPH
jgi:uncharacterized membrane protein YoaK (UPF0700 family)